MKKTFLVFLFIFCVNINFLNLYASLDKAPTKIEYFKEIAIKFDTRIPPLFNKLKSEERVFIYYIFRASLPGNKILTDQLHRHSLETIELFEKIIGQKDLLIKLKEFPNIDVFLDQVTTFLVYLWTNHGSYFTKEHVNEKRTPSKIGLNLLTPENLIKVLQILGEKNVQERVEKLRPFIFDEDFEKTLIVQDSIEKSAVNFYSPDFLESDYLSLSVQDRNGLNKYFFVTIQGDQRKAEFSTYKVNGKYGKELGISCYWLQKAYEYAQKYPETFDEHLIKSLDYLIEFLKTGEEKFFRKHSIEWLQSNSKVDYNFGFIECYEDPKSQRGSFEAEATIKSVDIEKLNSVLPKLEQQLPFPENFKRNDLEKSDKSIPNASINLKIFGSGFLGPMNIVNAYCLPNYDDIRSKNGSKQIIYKTEKGIGALVNPDLNRELFYLKERSDWFLKNDPDLNLCLDFWTVHVILHETIGHGSGKLAEHIFKVGENLTINNVDYKVGDNIKVTCENLSEFLSGYRNTIEELRAEIIALYISTHFLDDLNKVGFLVDWTKKLGKEKMEEWLVWDMANQGLDRLLSQDENSEEICGDHARANQTILNYLADDRGVEIVVEKKVIDGKQYDVLGCKVVDLQRAKTAIKDLAILVQTIKSTANILAAPKLINTYGKPINSEYIKIMKDNLKTVVGDVKVTASVYPKLIPVLDKSGQIKDVDAIWPSGIVEQQLDNLKLEYSTELLNSIYET